MSEAAGGSSAKAASNPGPLERDRLIKEFVLITKTDSAVAEYFLGESNWNLQSAIPDYFNVAGEIRKEDKTGLFKAVKNEKWASELESEAKVLGTFSFITWNVDGLDERNFHRRTENLVDTLKKEQADIVFLQEVVYLSLSMIKSSLSQYECIMQNSDEEYFIVTLLKKETVKLLNQKQEPYYNSVMGRGMLSVEVELGGTKLWLHNTHLESTADFKEARVQQLKTGFSKLTLNGNTHSTILAGDLNLRDAEVGLAGGIPRNCVDVWESCEKREECRYTWDSARNSNCLSKGGGGGSRGNFKPRLRFDRVYLHPCKDTSKPTPTPKHFKLIGVTKVPHMQCYISDHWAVQVFFTLNKY